MFLVIACPRCRLARVAPVGRKQASCGKCGKPLRLADLKAAPAASVEEAQEVAGRLNARLAGREREFAEAFLPRASRDLGHDDAFAAAAAATRRASSERDRADLVARELSKRLGAWSEDELARAFDVAGLPDPDAHLERMIATQRVHEPRAGRFRAL